MKLLITSALIVVVMIAVSAPVQGVELDIEGNAGYFHDFESGETYRGIAVKFAEKMLFGMPFTFSLAGIEQSTKIGDLDSSLVVSTDIKELFRKIDMKYTFPEEIEVGFFYSDVSGDSRFGMFMAIGYKF